MKTKHAALLLLVVVVALSACQRQLIHRYQSFSFGTLIELKIRHADKTDADKASSQLFAYFDAKHKEWHAWEPGKLSDLNEQLTSGNWFTTDDSLINLVKLAKTASEMSNHLFNPAIGKLIASWGFHSSDLPLAPPTQSKINSMLAMQPSMKDIIIDGNKLRGDNPHIKLDLGAIAKGHAVSEAIQMLRKTGIDHALINAGGDLCGIGDQGDRQWRIGIRDPSGKGILASIELGNNECVFTSGDYERHFNYQGKKYHHIIDPRHGYPAQQTTSVTVLHENGAMADAASTALFIAGPDGWQEIAKKMGIRAVMMVDSEGRIILSPSMHERIRLEPGNESRVVITSIAASGSLQ